MTLAELVVLAAVFGLLLWAFRPFQRLVRNRIERWLLSRRHGKVIEGRFRSIPGGEPPDDDAPSGDPH